MKQYFFAFFLILLIYSSCKKPSDNTDNFEKIYGGSLEDKANKVQILNGSLYVFGSTKSFNDADGDFYLIKLDLKGNLIWEKTYGGSSRESGSDFIATSDGNIILVGSTESYGSGLNDIHIIKINMDGNIIWEKTYGGSQNEGPGDIIELSNGGFCIIGTSTSFSTGTNDIYMLWIDENGNFIREKNYGGLENEAGAEILELENEELMVFAHIQSGAAETRDFYLLKTNAVGDSLWSKTYGGNDYEESQDFERTKEGGFLLCGHSASTDPIHNMYAIKLDEDGNIIWENNYGGAMHDGGHAVIINQDGNYVMVARSMSFGSGDRDAYMVVTDVNGSVISDKVIGGDKNDRIDDITENDEAYFLVGHSNSFSTDGNDDLYVVRVAK